MWNVFVPSCILNRKSGKLYGRVIGEERLVLIDEDSVHATHGHKSIGTFRKLVEEESNEDKNKIKSFNKCIFIDLCCNTDGDISCEIINNSEKLECNVVVFEPQQFVDSYFLKWNKLTETKSENIVDTLSLVDLNDARTVLLQKLQCMVIFLFQIIGYLLDNRYKLTHMSEIGLYYLSFFER